jgi:hypothetical protein
VRLLKRLLEVIVGKPVMLQEELAEVRMRRYNRTSEWEVVVVRAGVEISYKCRDYDQAMKWAQVECRSYRSSHIMVEQVDLSQGPHQND